MNVSVLSSAESVADFAAERIERSRAAGVLRVLGVATGATPIGMYSRLTAGRGEWARVQIVELDEYVGLPMTDERSFAAYVDRHIVGPLGIPPKHVHLLDGAAADPDREAQRYERTIARLGVDLQIVGIGRNGHIGFNEPGSSSATLTHVVRLHADTRAANAAAFRSPPDVPERAITQGIGTIRRARKLLMIATGAAKARAVAESMFGAPSESKPASLLRDHPDLEVLLDPAAARYLPADVRAGALASAQMLGERGDWIE